MDALAPVSRTGAVPRRLLRLRSDVALAERFAGGDEHAFAVLYERHRTSVLAICMGVLGSRHDAEDAAQEAFAALALSLRKGVPENLPAWLMRVARNAAIDVARRRRVDARATERVPDRAAGGEGVKADLESVMAGVRELPEAQRTALLMRELAGHSYREIATLLEVDEAAVHGLIARARISLRSFREAYEMSCAEARAALAAEPDGRRGDRTVRRHVRMCASCRAYKRALRGDARALRALVPDPAVPVASGGAVFGGIAAKGALIGGTVAQVTAACAVSACTIGGIVLVAPHVGHPFISFSGASRGTAARLGGGHVRHRSSPALARTAEPRSAVSPSAAEAFALPQAGDRAVGRPAVGTGLAGGRSSRTRSVRRLSVSRTGSAPVDGHWAWTHPTRTSPRAPQAGSYPAGQTQAGGAPQAEDGQHGDRPPRSDWQGGNSTDGHGGQSPGGQSARQWNDQSAGASSAGEGNGGPRAFSSRARSGRSGRQRWSDGAGHESDGALGRIGMGTGRSRASRPSHRGSSATSRQR
ncbi:MAG TPA: sigma-70 family RNA polymerase sigma factor [Solirubrobacteraceae bacterium]|nr:sigma-70 family RNA polymerase sigma factor [Solirubrobacteraceae bacterium]